MRLIAITNSLSLIADYQRVGVDCIMVDLERLGKAERQAGRAAWLSDHVPEDVSRARDVLVTTSLMVRVNPLNPGSCEEIDDVVRRGADVVMLPMARSAREASRFVELVGGRAKSSLLVETASLLAEMDGVAAISGLDEVHFGLNDLHISLGLRCMFEILSEGLLDGAAVALAAAKKPFGIGGVGALGSGPIDPKLILIEHARLGSSAVILSRAFFRGIDAAASAETVRRRVDDLRAYIASLPSLPDDVVRQNRAALRRNIATCLTSTA